MLEDFRLRVFCCIADSGSFTKAAKVLGISQPAVSQNIMELEKVVGRQLFERKRGQVGLTDDGRKFKKYADQILHWYDSANEALKNDFEQDVATVRIDDGSTLEIYSSCGDIHLKVNRS